MKKLLMFILIAGTCSFMSCGPSKEEQEAAEKAHQDSIKQVEAAAAQKAYEDSLAMVEKARHEQDSITAAKAAQDSIDKAKMDKANSKPKTTTKTDKPKNLKEMIEEAKKKQKK